MILPAIILAGWFFSCFFLVVGVNFLLGQWSIIFPQESPAVLAVADQLPLNQSPHEETFDERITILEQFLNKQDSPLASQSAAMIAIADTYKFDWRLLPAIAGKESSFSKKMPWDADNGQSSHNAWGWGVYGEQAPSFPTWEEAIGTVAKGLRHDYYNKGYITPEMIMKKFTPRSDGSWARDVKLIMGQIAPLEKGNDSKD